MNTQTLSHPDSIRVLEESPEDIYLYVSSSIRSELEHFLLLRENPEVKGDEYLLKLIDQHIESTEEQIRDFEMDGQEVMIDIKKPPSPQPPPKSVSYFTTNPKNRIELEFNGRTVLVERSYDQLTQILSVHLIEELTLNEDNQLTMSFEVSYTDRTGIQQTESLEWVMRF